jgi:hypothetical protein
MVIILLFFTLITGYTQNFPVRVTPILTPPYTPFLTDYTDPVFNKLTLHVLLNDITVPTYQCKLRLTIEGVNITIRSNPNYIPPPITLQGGVPQIIYGSDISDYFKTSNLVFQGLNPNEVNNNGGRLPEGIYRFTFEVLDYNRNTVVSNAGFAMAWMILNDPPLINMPVNNAKLKPFNPQNLVFQWTPRHSGSPNAAFTTEYDVKLVEIWPAGRNPYDAINALAPIYEATTSNTLIVYGPAETPLVLGREYAFQVRARDTGGKDLFKNNGYSEVVRFIYGDECPIPTGLGAEEIGINKARMRWQGSGLNTGYILRYREKKDEAHWFEERVSNTYVNATGLRPGANYEYEVCGECEAFQSAFTATNNLSTPAENPNAFVCGDPNAVPPITAGPPLQLLLTNDSIHAGGFDVIVSQATFNNPTFSGTGIAEIPWFNGAKVRVTFDGITVNQGHQLTSGEIVTVWDPNSKSMLYANEKPELTEEETETQNADSVSVEQIDLDVTIDTVFVANDGTIVVVDSAGQESTYDHPIDEQTGKPKEVVITDKNGDQWTVEKDPDTAETKVSKVEGGLPAGGNTVAQQEAFTKELELLGEFLERFELQIVDEIGSSYQPSFPRGGPAVDMFKPFMPNCMPDDHEKLGIIKQYVSNARNDENKRKALLDKIFQNAEHKELITTLANRDNPNNRTYEGLLSITENQKVEETLCPYVVEGAKLDYGEVWWRAPFWERAAKILKKHWRDQDIFEHVSIEYGTNECKVIGIINLAIDASTTMEVTFSDQQDPGAVWTLLYDTYGVDFLVARDVALETFSEWFWNYMAIKDDNLYQGKGWESAALNIFADVLMAPAGTIKGWVTGTHWRTGQELAMWEHALGILDIIPAEAFAKAGITAFVIKIGGQFIDVTKLAQPVKNFILSARSVGLKLLVKSRDEIVLFASNGTQQVGRMLNGVLQDIYWKYGGERMIARLAGVRYVIDPSTNKIVEGTLEIAEKGGSIGFRQIDDVWLLSLQKLGRAANSTVLGDNLVLVGKTRPANSHAHHITAGGASNPDAINSRLILQREGIDINEAVNGVFLPSSSKYAIDSAVPHANVHTKVYYEEIFNRLNSAASGKVREELQKIANELLDGTFPY